MAPRPKAGGSVSRHGRATPNAPSVITLPARGRSVPSVVEMSREWLTPEADELFRGIYARARLSSHMVLAVCSAIAGEGKTTLSLGLGLSVAQNYPERQVLVVETDVRRPVLAEDFGMMPSPGLVDFLASDVPLEAALRTTPLDNLRLCPSGGPITSPGRLLRSSHMAAAVDQMVQSHDLVILDVPAVLASGDALVLTEFADGLIFVVRAGVTPMHLFKRAIDEVDSEKLRGVVLNDVQTLTPTWLRRLLGA